MHPRNKMRLLAGLTIDPDLERQTVTEQRHVPMKKGDLAAKDGKNLGKKAAACRKAVAHIENAVKALDGAPATDFAGEIPHFVSELEDLLGSMREYAKSCDKEAKKAQPLTETHFGVGAKVYDKQGKCWEVTGSSKGTGDKELYKLKCPKTGEKRAKQASELHEEMNPQGRDTSAWDPEVRQAMMDAGIDPRDAKLSAVNKYEFENIYSAPTFPHQPVHVFGNVYRLGDTSTFITLVEQMGMNMGMSDPGAMGAAPQGAQDVPGKPNMNFEKGMAVMYDNGVWIVFLTDPQADKVGIIPPSMNGKDDEECAKAMQMVDPQKLHVPNDDEKKVLPGPDGVLGTEDDIRVESQKASYMKDMLDRAQKEGEKIKAEKKAKAEAEKKEKKVKESMHNFHTAYPETHADADNPINTVGGDWDTEHQSDLNTQLDNRGDQSMTDYEEKVAVPQSVKSSLREAVKSLRSDIDKLGVGHTAEETKIFYNDMANAFEDLLGLLDEGTQQGLKKAQLHAMSLMGPMLHKLPEGVWSFLTNGGPKRSLKDLMTDVSGKYPITGPRNS